MQVRTKSFSETANSRKVFTGVFRPTVPNRSQKEDVLTSSNYLRGKLRGGLAFPILLAAVGLLLASLVLGTRSNLVHALGEDDAGVCGYSELMRDAILANNGDESFDCDRAADDPDTTDVTERTYRTANANSWGGTKIDGDDTDAANDLDLSNEGISSFAPLKGELDGFVPGSRVDLRGNGLTVADLDVKAALETYEAFGNQSPPEPVRESVSRFGSTAAGNGIGLTFLLDGGSTTANGLTVDAFEGTEGEILWITFEYGAGDDDFTHPVDSDISVWMRVVFTITDDDSSSTVSAMINSNDPAGTLYAIPFVIPDDSDIEKTKREDIEASLGYAGTFSMVTAGSPGDSGIEYTNDQGATVDYEFTQTQFGDSLARKADEADLSVVDEDTPVVSVEDRQDAISDYLSDYFGLSDDDIGVDHLAGKVNGETGETPPLTYNDLPLTVLPVGAAPQVGDGPASDDAITSISVSDLAGLTGLTTLDLSDNELAELLSGLFAEVGTGDDGGGQLSTRIDLTGADQGPTGDGFTLENLGPVGSELSGGQYLVVNAPRKDDRAGFLQSSYEAVEGGVLVIDLNIQGVDAGATRRAVIQFQSLDGNSGAVSGDDPDVSKEFVDLNNLEANKNYRIAIQLPENAAETGDNTLTAFFGYLVNDGGNNVESSASDPDTTDPNVLNYNVDSDGELTPQDDLNIGSILKIAHITIRDASYEAPVPEPMAGESSFDSVVVAGNHFQAEDGSPHLNHNISNLLVTVGGNAINANFLDAYNATGGLDRWGLATSEVVEIETGTLTQFYQRGVLDFHDVGDGYIVERRLAWDYFGGDLGDNDQGVEAVPDVAPEGGVQVGAFRHYVANVDADGNATGFLDLFNSLGGVDAFGFPKTEARADTGAEATLSQTNSIGLTRQYFQAGIIQITPGSGLTELTLLGDDLRDVLVPGHKGETAFSAAAALNVGDSISPPVISS